MTDRSPRVHCPACGRRFRVPPERVEAAAGGLRGRCTGCRAPFRVRRTGDLLVAEAVPPPEAGKDADGKPRGRRRPRRAASAPPAAPAAAAAPAPLPAGERIGRYEVDVLLGRGGMGAVYRAFDPVANRHVALKVLRSDAAPEDRKRFQREVEVQGNVQHPHLMPIYDSGAIGTTRWYTMELLDRPLTLADVVALGRPGAPLPEARLRPLASLEGVLRHVYLPVCDAIHHANVREGVLHRDLKPGNVLVDRKGPRAWVIDFGVCSLLERKNERLAHLARETGEVGPDGRLRVTGTLGWMPPEQARGETDRHGDVWALGALLRYVATGEPPYVPAARTGVGRDDRVAGLRLLLEQAERQGNAAEAGEYRGLLRELESSGDRSTEDLARDVLAARYAPLPASVDRNLAAVIEKAMAADPAARYRHALELRDDVLAWLERRPLRAVAETTGVARRTVYRGALFLRRHVLLLGVGVLALAGGLGLALGLREEPPPRADDGALLQEAAQAEADGRRADARRLALAAIALRPERGEGFALLRRLDETERAERLAERAEELARAADERFRVGDEAAGEALLAQLALALDLLGPSAALPPARGADLARRARRELPLALVPAFAAMEVSVVPVEDDGRILWGRAAPAGPVVTRGRWILRARRGEGETCVPFAAAGPDGPVEVTIPVDPGTLPAGTLYVPGGRVRGPRGTADVGALLWERTEVTEERYARFLDGLPPEERRLRVPRLPGALGAPDRPLWPEKEGRFVPPAGAARRPVEAISPYDARAFARAQGRRLPTAEEWVFAASGPDGRATPVGPLAAALRPGLRVGTGGGPGDVGAAAEDRSPFGLADMAGNVAEWTSTLAPWRGTLGWWALGGSYAKDAAAAVVLEADPRPGWVPAVGVGLRLVLDAPAR